MSNEIIPMNFANEAGVFLRPVTDITVYWRGPVIKHRSGIGNFFSTAMRVVGQSIKYYKTQDMESFRAVTPAALQILPKLLRKPRVAPGIYMLALESSSSADEPSDEGFYFLCDEEEDVKVGLMRIILPVGAMENGYSSIESILNQALLDFEFDSGHAGFSVNWDPEGESDSEAEQAMSVIARKYPGIDLNDVNSTIIAWQRSKGAAIKCVNWATILGRELRERLSEEQIGTLRQGACEVHDTGDWIAVVAGPKPVLGYPKRDELDPYHVAGRVMRQMRLSWHPQIFSGSTTDDWLSRFD